MNDTPITDRAEKSFRDETGIRDAVGFEDMRALELAANGLRTALLSAEWTTRGDVDSGFWQMCDECCNEKQHGHAKDCPKAIALTTFATLQPKEPHE